MNITSVNQLISALWDVLDVSLFVLDSLQWASSVVTLECENQVLKSTKPTRKEKEGKHWAFACLRTFFKSTQADISLFLYWDQLWLSQFWWKLVCFFKNERNNKDLDEYEQFDDFWTPHNQQK